MSETIESTGAAFSKSFPSVKPLISAEWPAVDEAALDATGGDYQEVVDLVVRQTEQDPELVERQLAELQQVAAEEAPAPSGTAEKTQRPMHEALRTMQSKMNEVADYVRKQLVDDARTRARDNFLVTLLMAIGLGFIVGFVLRGLGRGRS